MTDRLAVAAGPLLAVESLAMDPAVFAGPNQRFLTGGYPTFPAGFHQRPFWGGGFQVGAFYEMSDEWNLGFSYKSPIWQERWGYNSADAIGHPKRIGVQASLPEIFSWGVAYKGLPGALIDLDLRYLDYANTDLFGTAAPPRGTGMGWRSVFALALGGQYALTDRLTLRAGYLFNTNPVPSEKTLLNVQLPAITQHTLTFGATYKLTDDIAFSAGYAHAFRNSISGPIAQFANTSVREDVQIDSILAGLNIQFGGRRRSRPAPAPGPVAQAEPAPTDPQVQATSAARDAGTSTAP